MKANININQNKFKERFTGLELEQLNITIDNIQRLDDLNELKYNGNFRQEIIQKLLLLTDDNYATAIDRLESIPNFKLDSLLDSTLDAKKMESLFRIAHYCHAAEFGDLKDRGKQFMNNEELSNLISLHNQLTNNQINIIGSALNEDLDYNRLIRFAQIPQFDSNQIFDELQHLRQNKANVFQLLRQDGYQTKNITPERLRHLFQAYEKSNFKLADELLVPLNNTVFREFNNYNISKDKESISSTERVLKQIIQQIAEKPSSWHNAWKHVGGMPVNPITGTEYSGINFISLAISQSNMQTDDPRWCSFKQAQAKGYQVNKGSKSPASVLFYSVKHEFTILGNKLKIDNKLVVSGKSNSDTIKDLATTLVKHYPQREKLITKVVNENNKSLDNIVEKLNQLAFGANVIKLHTSVIDHHTPVFNFSQLQNTPRLVNSETKPKWQPCVQADTIVQAMSAATGLQVRNDSLGLCGYNNESNTIRMVNPSGFQTPESYYSSLLHEVAHARMREPNAIQELRLSFSPELYHVSIDERSKEELRAELCAVFTCSKIGLSYDLDNHVAYLDSWLKELKQNPRELLSAAIEANRVSNSILSRTHEYLISNNLNWEEFRTLKLCEVKDDSIPTIDEPVKNNDLFHIDKNPVMNTEMDEPNDLEPQQHRRRR